MKSTEKDKPVKTIPRGVWESSIPPKSDDKKNPCTPATDLQGNGYPDKKQR